MILSVLPLRYIKDQVSKSGINVHKQDQVHFSRNKKGTFAIWPKGTFLFYFVGNYYLQFRI